MLSLITLVSILFQAFNDIRDSFENSPSISSYKRCEDESGIDLAIIESSGGNSNLVISNLRKKRIIKSFIHRQTIINILENKLGLFNKIDN
ncbi:MAG: hypothetical protein ACTSW1_01560 [Candidatus Hodarchaeales archaeon]